MPDSRSHLQAILNHKSSSVEEKAQARRELDALEADADAEPPAFSERAQTLLCRFGKPHLAEITEVEWEQYVKQHAITSLDPLTREVRDWVPAGDEILDLLGMSRADWWRSILKHAKSDAVRANARKRLRILEANHDRSVGKA